MVYLVILFILAVLAAVLFFVEIKCVIKYIRNDIDDNISISLYVMNGIIKYKYEIPLVDVGSRGVRFKLVREGKKIGTTGEKPKRLKISDIQDKYLIVRKYYLANKELICDLRDYIKTRIKLVEFDLNISEGTENACHTGIICGVLWYAAGLITTFLTNTFNTFRKYVSIRPNYKKREFFVDLFCIFHVKLVHIIVMATKIHFIGINGKQKFMKETGGGSNGGTSDRRADDDSNGKYQGNG